MATDTESWNWNEEELEAMKKFKQALTEKQIQLNNGVRYSEYEWIRFLRARKMDPIESSAMFDRYQKWREQFQIDKLLANPTHFIPDFECLKNYFPGDFHGRDKLGMPVYYERLGSVDVKNLLKHFSADQLILFHIFSQEELVSRVTETAKRQRHPETGHILFGNIVVEDLAGLGWAHSSREAFSLMKKTIEIDEDNYPETLKRLYVINAPRIFSVIWKIVSLWFDPRTLAKIRISSGDAKEALLEDISIDQLPVEYGGACSCSGDASDHHQGKRCLHGGGPFTPSCDSSITTTTMTAGSTTTTNTSASSPSPSSYIDTSV